MVILFIGVLCILDISLRLALMSVNSCKRITDRKMRLGKESKSRYQAKKSVLVASSGVIRLAYNVVRIFKNILIMIYPVLVVIFVVSFLILVSVAPSLLLLFSETT